MEFDNVEKPPHYNDTKFECIDVLEDWLSSEEFRGFLLGNVFKYQKRYKNKNGVEDLKKARWYLNRLIKTYEDKNNVET